MLIEFIKPLSLTLLSLTLASCGGSGGSSSPNNPTQPATVKSIVPYGVMAPVSNQPLSIAGTNFVSGMIISVDNINYPAVVSSPTVINANVAINTVPANNIANVSVKSSSGTTIGTVTLGVASADVRLSNTSALWNIFDTKCRSCHTGNASGNLDLSSPAAIAANLATGLIGIPSSICSPKFRVVVGDPRPASSVLIDKIKSASPCSGNPMPPFGSTLLTPAEIQTIVDWVAGGAN